jgi:hypothetical protein
LNGETGAEEEGKGVEKEFNQRRKIILFKKPKC